MSLCCGVELFYWRHTLVCISEETPPSPDSCKIMHHYNHSSRSIQNTKHVNEGCGETNGCTTILEAIWEAMYTREKGTGLWLETWGYSWVCFYVTLGSFFTSLYFISCPTIYCLSSLLRMFEWMGMSRLSQCISTVPGSNLSNGLSTCL